MPPNSCYRPPRSPQIFSINQRVSTCLRVPHPSRLSAKGGLLPSNGEIFCSGLFSLPHYFTSSTSPTLFIAPLLQSPRDQNRCHPQAIRRGCPNNLNSTP